MPDSRGPIRGKLQRGLGMPWACCAAWALAFAQAEAPPKPAAPAPAVAEAPPKAAGGKPAAPGKLAEPEPPQANAFGQFLPFGILLAAAYFLLILPNQRNERQRKEQLSAVKKDDRVVTSSGLFGVVANIEADTVTLKVDESRDVRMKFRKSAIVEILKNKDA